MPQYLMSVWHDDGLRRRLHQRRGPTPRPPRSTPSTTSSRQPAPGCSAAGCTPPSSATVVRVHGRPGVDDRRPLRRDQGADGRLLGHRGRRPRRRPRLGRARPPPPARARSRSARSRVSDDARRRLPARGRPLHRHPDPRPRRRRPRRGRGRGGVRHRRRALAGHRASRRTPAAGSPRRPATGPSTGSAGKSTRTDRHLAAHRLHDPDMEPDDPTPSSTTSTTSSTSSPTTSCA